MNGGKTSYEHYYSKFLLKGFQGERPGGSNEGLIRLTYEETDFGYGRFDDLHWSRESTPLSVRTVLGEMDFYSTLSLHEGAEDLLTDVEREAKLAILDLQARRAISSLRYFALSQYMRLLLVRSKPWVDANGLALFDSLVAQRPTDGVIFSVSLQRTQTQGWFVSPHRPLGSQNLFATTLYTAGDETMDDHVTDLLAHAPTKRHEYAMLYAHPEQRDDGFFLRQQSRRRWNQ